MNSEPQISVIIPILAGDDCWKSLITDLVHFPDSSEFLFISSGDQPPEFQELVDRLQIHDRSQWYRSSVGRAVQMNLGASKARYSSLLFLHSDSRLKEYSVQRLVQSLSTFPNALHYFDLNFQDQSNLLMHLNQWGVSFRSHILGIPFGDQGLCLNRDQFFKLGGYDETVSYGEDHLLVWKTRRSGIHLKCIGATIETSSRKYQKHGWLKITTRHLWLTVRQAVPQFFLLIKDRLAAWVPGKAQSPSS